MIVISWNVVNVNFRANQALRQHIREKITELEKYLSDSLSDSGHLLIEFKRDHETDLYTATLSLRLPANIVHSQASASDVQQAFDQALNPLADQARQKATPGEEKQPMRFTDQPIEQPMVEGEGSQSSEDMARQQAHQHA